MAMTPKGWSISALAVELGRDRRTIAAAVANLKPMDRDGRSDLYRLTDVLPLLMGPGKPTTFDDAKTRKMAAEAELAEAELARVRGSQVPIADTVKVVEEICIAIRAKCLAVPTKHAPILLVAERTEASYRAALDTAMREVLHELVADAAGHDEGRGTSGDGGGTETPADADGQSVGGHLSQAFL